MEAPSSPLFQVDAGGGGVLWQSVRGAAGVHQMAKCQLLQTLSQVGLLGMKRWQAAPFHHFLLNSSLNCSIGTFYAHASCWIPLLFLILPFLRGLVITIHLAGSSFLSWLRNSPPPPRRRPLTWIWLSPDVTRTEHRGCLSQFPDEVP